MQAEHDYGFRVGIESLPLLPLLAPSQRPNRDLECSLCIHKNNETMEAGRFLFITHHLAVDDQQQVLAPEAENGARTNHDVSPLLL